MKTYLLGAVIAGSWLLSGCANEQQTTTTRTTRSTVTDNPSERIYTEEDLDRSGQARTGQALRQIDPAINSRGRP